MDYKEGSVRLKGEGKRFTTFPANRFLINKDHTGKDSLPQRVSIVRVRDKNIGHYWWMSVLSRMKPVLGM